MTKVILKEQLERNVFAYVDDIVVEQEERNSVAGFSRPSLACEEHN
jgi:hypothetical protein